MRSVLDVKQLPTGRNGRLLAAGILAVVIGLGWMVIAAPLLDWYEARSQALAQQTRYAARMAALAAELPQARAEAAAARLQAPPPDMILSGSSDTVAGAALESLIDGLTHDAGATLISTESIQAVQVGQYRRIGLHATARASWTKLIHLLAAIERADPRMSIGNLQIQAGPLGGPEQLLDMSLSVSAFRAGTVAQDNADSSDTGAAP